MSSKADERAERVALLALAFRRITDADKVNAFRCFIAAREAVKIADRQKRAAENYCNYGDEEKYDRRAESARKKLNDLMAGLGLDLLDGMWEVQGDPRGAVVKLRYPGIDSNGWGNDGWCV